MTERQFQDLLLRMLRGYRLSRDEVAALRLMLFEVLQAVRWESLDPPSYGVHVVLASALAARAGFQMRTLIAALPGSRADAVERLVEYAEVDVAQWARRLRGLEAGRITVEEWSQNMRQMIRSQAAASSLLGAGRILDRAEYGLVEGHIAFQERRLMDFSHEIAARELIGRPFTLAYIIDRSRQYAGAAKALYYQKSEETMGPGTVIRIEGADDGGTCGPCMNGMLGGPYLPGEGFMPVRDCEAKGKCRHRRVPYFDREAYARLTA